MAPAQPDRRERTGGSRDRAAGALLGLAAGDRNGGPIRFAVRLAESLAETGRFDAGEILRRYVEWWREGAFDTGPVAAGVLTRVASGMPPREAAAAVHEHLEGLTAGCNPAHRIAPLAMAAFLDEDNLARAAAEEARLTHLHPLAGEAAAAVALMVRALIRGLPLEEGVARAARLLEAGAGTATGPPAGAARAHLPPGQEAFGRVRPAGPSGIAEALADAGERRAGRGGFAPVALQTGLHFALRAPEFESGLEAALDYAGPANYGPVITGALLGARFGAAAVPAEALAHCGILSRVEPVARELAAGWPES